jgi:hypothetical protein
VEAASPIILYSNMTTKFGGEMWTPIPVEEWGKEYIVSALPGEIITDHGVDAQLRELKRNAMGCAEVAIIAAYDNTTVNIYPTGITQGAPLTVTLNAHDVYEIRSFVDTLTAHKDSPQADIGGSRIVATRPVGVISGNTRAQVTQDATASTGNSFKNMGMEWLAPTEEFGTEFVYTPTWDSRHLTGALGEKGSDKRGYELMRIYGTTPTPSRSFFRQDTSHVDTAMISSGKFAEYRVSATRPHLIRTEKPAQGMMYSGAVSRNNGLISPGNFSYDTWSPYTVELVPREQWTTFAPYFAPFFPYETEHYINVVADTNELDMIYDEYGAPFDFNKGVIPGTDLMWGTYRVEAGKVHYLQGRDGARFFAYMYGVRQGYEQDFPYRETMALSYGLPLAPERRILRAADSLRIDTTRTPCGMRINVSAVNSNAVGLRSAGLESGSTNLVFSVVTPNDPGGIIGYTSATFMVAPLDPLRDASGTVVITDRTGASHRVPYSYLADRVRFNVDGTFDFGQVNLNEQKDTVVVITNPSTRPICLNRVRLKFGDEAIAIVSSSPSLPSPSGTVMLGPHDTLRVTLRALPSIKGKNYRDSLLLDLCCSEWSLPLRLAGAEPCIEVEDLDFGILTINQPKTLGLRICNHGGGTLVLNNGSGDSVITWLARNFSIDKSTLDSLRNVVLGSNACITVPVTFQSNIPDTFTTTARVWASTRDCRDTSVWRAIVKLPTSVPGARDEASEIVSIYPDPASSRVAITLSLASPGVARIEIYNAIGERVAMLGDARNDAGERTLVWDVSNEPSGVYYCRLIVGGRGVTRAVRVER